MAQYDYPGWAVVEWECCIKHPEAGAAEGAKFITRPDHPRHGSGLRRLRQRGRRRGAQSQDSRPWLSCRAKTAQRRSSFHATCSFAGSDPDFVAHGIADKRLGLIASRVIGGSFGGLDPSLPYDYSSTSARGRFRLRRAYCSNGIDARRAARRKVACEKRHRRKQYHNHD